MTAETQPRQRSTEGEVFDLGYQRFEGERQGRPEALRAIWRDSIRASLGLGRSLSSKLLPLGLIVLVLLPAAFVMVIAGFVSSFGDLNDFELDGFSNREYYQLALIPLILYASLIGPEMFCPDRRSSVLVLYFTRPLTPMNYVAARWFGFLTVSTLILWLPQVLLFATHSVIADSPAKWARDNFEIIPQAAASGIVVAAMLTTVSLAVSSFTDRRPYAAGATLGVLILFSIVGELLADLITGSTGDYLELIDMLQAVLNVNDWIFGDVQPHVALSSWFYLADVAFIVALGWVVMWWRYRGAAG